VGSSALRSGGVAGGRALRRVRRKGGVKAGTPGVCEPLKGRGHTARTPFNGSNGGRTVTAGRRHEWWDMADLAFVVLTVGTFVVLALVVRAVERL
jgi:hypothetical protein